MHRCRCLLITLLLLATTDPLHAGIFRKGPKPKPEERVPVLIQTLKTEPDERKRVDAAEELGEYDPKSFPDLVPSLINALLNDTSASVRREAAKSIGELRPISQQAGFALEMAIQNDPSVLVRVAARTSLGIYHLMGYRSKKPTEGIPHQTEEPPLAVPLAPIQSTPQSGVVGPRVPRAPLPLPLRKNDRPAPPLLSQSGQSIEPPLAVPVPQPEASPKIPTQDGPLLTPPPLLAPPPVIAPKRSNETCGLISS